MLSVHRKLVRSASSVPIDMSSYDKHTSGILVHLPTKSRPLHFPHRNARDEPPYRSAWSSPPPRFSSPRRPLQPGRLIFITFSRVCARSSVRRPRALPEAEEPAEVGEEAAEPPATATTPPAAPPAAPAVLAPCPARSSLFNSLSLMGWIILADILYNTSLDQNMRVVH